MRIRVLSATLLIGGLATARLLAEGVELESFIRDFQADRNDVQRFYSWPWSEAAFDRNERLITDWQNRLNAIAFDGLSQQGRIDWLLLRNFLEHEVEQLKLQRRWLTEIQDLLPFRKDLLETVRRHYAMDPIDPATSAKFLGTIPDDLRKLRERIDRGREAIKTVTTRPTDPVAKLPGDPGNEPIFVTPAAARRASRAIDSLRWSLREWFDFYNGYDPEFSWWVRKPYDDAGAAIDEFSRYLREEIAGLRGRDDDPLVGDPIGPAAIAADLRNEMIAYSADELIRIGEREFAWCEQQMKVAASEMGCGDDWKKALDLVKSDVSPPGQQDRLAREQSRAVIQFIRERDLVTIPPLCDELWRLTRIGPETQRVLPFAAYGGLNMMVSAPSDTMKHADKLMSMRGNNRHFNHIVAPHELIPGHHLQGFVSQRERPYRGLFSTPFFVEGWCLHWEMLLWDLGYGTTPQDRIGMLFWRMHRAARIIVSLKFQLGQMTPPEMVTFLIERVGHEPMTAAGEVRRFIGGDYSPLYQVGYMIGGLQIRAIRKQLVEGGKLTERQFHDAVLTYGAIPIELIRAGLLSEPLTREYRAQWRFADSSP